MMAGRYSQFKLTLSALLQGIVEFKSEADRTLTGMSLDSREIQSGDLFLACPGLNVDGASFIDEAIHNGAVAVLWEAQEGIHSIALSYRTKPNGDTVPVIAVANLSQQVGILADRFYGQPSRALFVSGVTGTNGKTTVAYLIESILSQAGYNVGVIGTINYRYGDQIFPNSMTTPESLEVMLMSPRVDASGLFGDLRLVIVDEIHALAGTDRGAHLMSVLERLEAGQGPLDDLDPEHERDAGDHRHRDGEERRRDPEQRSAGRRSRQGRAHPCADGT